MNVGTAITQTLSLKGINAAEVARRSGLRPGTISSYQSGRTTPSLQALQLIAAALDVRVSEMIALAETGASDENPRPDLALHQPMAAYRLEDDEAAQGRMLASFSALSDRQRRALLNFLEAMEETP